MLSSRRHYDSMLKSKFCIIVSAEKCIYSEDGYLRVYKFHDNYKKAEFCWKLLFHAGILLELIKSKFTCQRKAYALTLLLLRGLKKLKIRSISSHQLSSFSLLILSQLNSFSFGFLFLHLYNYSQWTGSGSNQHTHVMCMP